MSKVLVTESYLEDIADAIRTKNGSSDTYTPGEMAGAIDAISGGITPTGTINITQNGTTDVTNYASANVNVPNPSTGTINITSNGTVDVTNYASANVSVPNPSTGTKQISITQNGTTTEDVTNYASAEIAVNVSASSGVTELASGTVVGNGNTLDIPVGTRMAQTNFVAVVTVPNGTEYPYTTGYKNMSGVFICDSTLGSFDLSADGTGILPTSKFAYTINNSGSITDVSQFGASGSGFNIRNVTVTGAAVADGYMKINRSSSGFVLRVRMGVGSWRSDVTHTYRVFYYGSNPSTDIVTVS